MGKVAICGKNVKALLRPGLAPVYFYTSREKEVAALVAQGLTNRQIAQELVISERTVDNHVANILKKLGLRSREQVIAQVAE